MLHLIFACSCEVHGNSALQDTAHTAENKLSACTSRVHARLLVPNTEGFSVARGYIILELLRAAYALLPACPRAYVRAL